MGDAADTIRRVQQEQRRATEVRLDRVREERRKKAEEERRRAEEDALAKLVRKQRRETKRADQRRAEEAQQAPEFNLSPDMFVGHDPGFEDAFKRDGHGLAPEYGPPKKATFRG